MKSRGGNKSDTSRKKADDKENVRSGLLYARADTKKGDEPLKTSVLVERNVISAQANEAALSAQMAVQVSIIPSHRPVAAITEYSDIGSPLKMETPGRTQLIRVAKYGPISMFSNLSSQPVIPAVPALQVEAEFYHSEQYKSIRRVMDSVKYQEITVTPELLSESKKEHQSRGSRRAVSQQRVMVESQMNENKGSATQYANATELFDGKMKWEWLHLVAHSILDKRSQQPDNLVAGTAHANTDMLLFESEIAYLAKAYPDGFKLKVKADLIEGTHIAKHIEYRIETKDFTLPIVFDALTTRQPHISYKDYVHAIMKSLVEAHRGVIAQEALTSTSTFPFFSRGVVTPSAEAPVETPKPKK